MTKDMTAGKPLGLILRFCGPMVFGNILQQLYSMVDTVIVGRYLGASALAGVGATGAISFLVVGFATGICTGLSIPVAQAFGAGDYHSMRKNIANSYYLGALIGVLLTILTMIGTGTILHWMKTPDDIYQYSYDYIIVIFGGILTSVLYNSLAAILRAVGDSKSPILFLAISSVLNIILDLVFLVGMQSGVAGAGYATVISQGISGILCLGSLAVTSVTAAQKICAIVMGPLESLGITMATFWGQNLGAKKFYRIRDGIRLSMYVSMCYCAFCIAFLWILGKYTAYLFLDPSETEVIRLAVQYMRWNAVFYPVLGVLFILRNSLQGMGYSLMPMMAGVSELPARSLVCFGFVPTFGYMAAIMASPVAWIFADVLLIIVYFVDMRKLKRRLVPAEAAMAA